MTSLVKSNPIIDIALKTLSKTRDVLDNQLLIVADHVLQMRGIINKQSDSIAEGDDVIDELQAGNKRMKIVINQANGELKDLRADLKATRAVLEARTRQTDELKMENVARLDKIAALHDRLAIVLNKPRYQSGGRMAREFADLILNARKLGREDALPELQALAAEEPNLARKMKLSQMDRMENVCRLAHAAIIHLETITLDDCHIDAAVALLKPLATGVHDVEKWHGGAKWWETVGQERSSTPFADLIWNLKDDQWGTVWVNEED